MSETKNFANEPLSVGAIRAHKEMDARKWTPRDALIDLLRDIDGGAVKVSDIIIVYRGTDKAEKEPTNGYIRAGQADGRTMNVGMLESVKYMLLNE